MHLREELENCKVRGLVSLKLTIGVNNIKISVDSTLTLTKMKRFFNSKSQTRSYVKKSTRRIAVTNEPSDGPADGDFHQSSSYRPERIPT